MKVSVLIELVMQLATQEAIAADFGEISPEHLLTGLLKFAEFPVEQAAVVGIEADAHQLLADSVRYLQKELAARLIDGKQVRRKLRAKLGKGTQPHQGQYISRSPAAREVFDRAAVIADAKHNEAIEPQHLLESLLASPTPAMIDVLGDALRPTPTPGTETPLLDRWGKDLTELARSGCLPATPSCVEGTALLQALAEDGHPSLFLMAEKEWDAHNAIHMAAFMMISPESPAAPQWHGRLRDRRLIDLRKLGSEPPNGDDLVTLHEKLWAEAEHNPSVILIDSLDSTSILAEAEGSWASMQEKLTRRAVQAIVVVMPQTYRRLIDTDRRWKRLMRVMHVGHHSPAEIPDKI